MSNRSSLNTTHPAPALAAVILIASAACSSGGGSESATAGEWQAETTIEGDVTTVRTISGSIWGGDAVLEEVLTIGVESGEDAYMLGNVSGVAQFGEEIFVLDRQVPTVRVYDLSGTHLRDLGREGQGPGELRQPEAMVIGPDGRVYLRDPRNGRIMVLDTQGAEVGTITIRSGFQTSAPMVITHDGTLYNSQLLDTDVDVAEWVSGFVPLSVDGEAAGDPVIPPDFDFESARIEARVEGSVSINSVPFSPASEWAFSSWGVQISGISTDYRFDILYPDGRVTRVIKAWQPVPVDPAEATWQRRIATVNMRRTQPDWTWNGPPIPAHKPAYSDFLPDRAGRIWVSRPGPGRHVDGDCIEDPDLDNISDAYNAPCWQADTTWEVFDEEGRFLGAARLPEGVRTFPNPYITEEHFLTHFMDDDGTVMVKRYRIVLPTD